LIPALLADVADDEELLDLALDGLSSQLEAELPLEYHLVGLANKVLRIGARRDAAAEIPTPDDDLALSKPPEHTDYNDAAWAIERRRRLEEWWPEFARHAMLVVANRNVHKHQASCLAGKQGKYGCRFNAPWGHNVQKTRLVELFCDDTQPMPTERFEYRCPHCYADGAMRDTTNLEEVNERKTADANNRRDLCYITAKPTAKPNVGDDARLLHVDLKRSTLLAPDTIKEALVSYAVDETPDTAAGLRKALRKTIEGNELANLLSTPALKDLRDRLMELSDDPLQTSDIFKVYSASSLPTMGSFLVTATTVIIYTQNPNKPYSKAEHVYAYREFQPLSFCWNTGRTKTLHVVTAA
jgi:hypothetical protein